MTTGELLDSESTVTGVSALTHLQNLEGTGGGTPFPYTDITIAMTSHNVEAKIDTQVLEATLDNQELTVEFVEPVYNVTFESETNDINLNC